MKSVSLNLEEVQYLKDYFFRTERFELASNLVELQNELVRSNKKSKVVSRKLIGGWITEREICKGVNKRSVDDVVFTNFLEDFFSESDNTNFKAIEKNG